MPLITWDLDNNLLDLSGLDTSFQDKLELPAPSEQTIRIGFYRQTSGDARQYLDIGSDPSIEFLIKQSTGTGKYDAAPVVASPTFTRTAVDDLGNYYYDGSLSLSAPVFLKDLGINTDIAREIVTVQCGANEDGSLGGRYWDYAGVRNGNAEIFRIWYDSQSSSTQPDNTGVTLIQVTLSSDDLTAEQVADETRTELMSDVNFYGVGMSVATNGISYTGDTLEITASNFTRLGAHNPRTSGFLITVTTAGGYPSQNTDVDSVSYMAQIVYLDGTAPQLSPRFTLELENSLYRDGQTFPAATISANYRTGSVVLSASDSATVTFSSPMASADYKLVESAVRYTGAAAPGLKLCACTIDDRSTTGFTVYFNGDATNDYTYDYTVTL